MSAITWKIVLKTTDYPDFTDAYIAEPKKISGIWVISGFLPLIPQISSCLYSEFLPYVGTLQKKADRPETDLDAELIKPEIRYFALNLEEAIKALLSSELLALIDLNAPESLNAIFGDDTIYTDEAAALLTKATPHS